MQAAINAFIQRGSHAWMAATHASRFLSLTMYPEGCAMTVEDHVTLSIRRRPTPPHMCLVIEQQGEGIEGAQRYLEAIEWWLMKLVPDLRLFPVELVSHFYSGKLVNPPGIVRRLDLGGESSATFHVNANWRLLVNLESIDLSYSLSLCREITDIELLRECRELHAICVCGSDIVDVAWVNTDVVEVLDVRWCNDLVDLAALGKATALRELLLNMNPITDVTALAGCKQLKNLTLTACESLENFLPLAALSTHLERLDISGTGVTSLDFLSDFARLTSLNLGDCCAVHDLTPLAGLRTLQQLCVDHTAITSLAPLALCASLEELRARHCALLTDVTPLKDLTHLRVLVVARSAVHDVSCLSLCPALAKLDVRECHLSYPATAEAFARWPALTHLYLEETPMVWDDSLATPLQGLSFLDIRDWRRSSGH